MCLVGSGSHDCCCVYIGDGCLQTCYNGLWLLCLATGWMELSPGPRSMGLSLKRGPSYDTEMVLQNQGQAYVQAVPVLACLLSAS